MWRHWQVFVMWHLRSTPKPPLNNPLPWKSSKWLSQWTKWWCSGVFGIWARRGRGLEWSFPPLLWSQSTRSGRWGGFGRWKGSGWRSSDHRPNSSFPAGPLIKIYWSNYYHIAHIIISYASGNLSIQEELTFDRPMLGRCLHSS